MYKYLCSISNQFFFFQMLAAFNYKLKKKRKKEKEKRKDDPNQCQTWPAKCWFGPLITILDEARKENNWARST